MHPERFFVVRAGRLAVSFTAAVVLLALHSLPAVADEPVGETPPSDQKARMAADTQPAAADEPGTAPGDQPATQARGSAPNGAPDWERSVVSSSPKSPFDNAPEVAIVDGSDEIPMRERLDKSCCDGKDPDACLRLCDLWYWDRNGVGRDRGRSTEYARKACDLEHPVGCYKFGVALRDGLGVSPDPRRAVEILEYNCKHRKHAASCDSVGAIMQWGLGLEPAPETAAQFYGDACQAESAVGCNNLGALLAMAFQDSRKRTDAIEVFDKSCELGSADGCGNLGVMYIREGDMQSVAQADAAFDKACRLGSDQGCFNSAVSMLGLHDGASRALDDACEPESADFVCQALDLDIMVLMAINLFSTTCDQGYAKSCDALGNILQVGRFVPKNEKLAGEMFGKACELGFQASCPAPAPAPAPGNGD